MKSLGDILREKVTVVVRRRRWIQRSDRTVDVNLALYIIGFEDPKITAFKIGVSNNVDRRLDQLQTGCPWRLEVKALIYRPDAYNFEKYLHGVHRKYRIRQDGEWFDFGLPADSYVNIVTGGRLR